MAQSDWARGQQVALFYTCHEQQHAYSPVTHAIAILYNASSEEVLFTLPSGLVSEWMLRFCSSDVPPAEPNPGQWRLPPRCMILATMGIDL